MKDAIISKGVKRVFSTILLWLLFIIPSIAQERLPQAVPYSSLALVPDLAGDQVAVTVERSLEALNAVEDISPHGVSGVLQLQPKPTRSNPFRHLTEG